ncbi:ATP synthase epsilon chain [Marinomonas aquimarina]|uniref:ATP synthase epsilon chain n=1 Tax=Marinomonas aquimarina TaxID=295068 RepID=A0A1A8TDM3_9GAMM|nr:F0F1 ATP synthase subunit epsilon [Marinomonas aquimarina]SBS30935.1 ATP synthase epsilon chain [Marinomonas aquimarina]
MSHTILCDIVSAERTLYSNLVKYVVVQADHGELGIFPGHAPLLTTLKTGSARLVKEDDSEEIMFISGGFMEVQPHKVILLADFAQRASELDMEEALAAKQHAEEHLGNSSNELDHTRALKELNEALARIRAIEQNRRIGHFVDKNHVHPKY